MELVYCSLLIQVSVDPRPRDACVERHRAERIETNDMQRHQFGAGILGLFDILDLQFAVGGDPKAEPLRVPNVERLDLTGSEVRGRVVLPVGVEKNG